VSLAEHDLQLDTEQLAGELERARRRTLGLLDGLSESEQRAQVSTLMSPLVWDLAHIGNYEELWLLRAVDGRAPRDAALDDLYNAFEHPRWERPSLPILGPVEARAYLAEVRAEVLDLLGRLDHVRLGPQADRLVDDGFVYGMVLQHEHQHDETILATLQLRGEDATPPPRLDERQAGPSPTTSPNGRSAGRDDVRDRDGMRTVDGGTYSVGTSSFAWAYDNERHAHLVEVAPFEIDVAPVTNAAYLAFMADGGYVDERLWAPEGWAHRCDHALAHPQHWRDEGDGAWSLLRFGQRLDLADRLDEPVQHVCWYEADAYLRWAGRRLPTEVEWEVAAMGCRDGDDTGIPWPWGGRRPTAAEANLGQVRDGPRSTHEAAPASAAGCRAMFGDVWEWTASDFTAYPGFEAWPYREYSEVFWGSDYKVLRGGSWATDPIAMRGTFRNWDYPIRRQIFAGFRGARDA
jgi:iron(II)-dependent oxidoreductase